MATKKITREEVRRLSLEEWYELNQGVEVQHLEDIRTFKDGDIVFAVQDNTEGYWSEDQPLCEIICTSFGADDSSDEKGFLFSSEEAAERYAEYRSFLLGCKLIREEKEKEELLESFDSWLLEPEFDTRPDIVF